MHKKFNFYCVKNVDKSDKFCREWFRRLKSGYFSVEDQVRLGKSKKFEDEELEILLNEDSCQTQKEFVKNIVNYSTSYFEITQSCGIHPKARQLGAVRIETERYRKTI